VFFVMKWKSPEGSRCLLEFVVSHGTHNQTCLVHSRISRPQRRKKINCEPAALMGVTVSLNWTAFAALPSCLRASEWCFQSFRHWRLEIGSLPMCVSMDYADNIPASAGQGSACADQAMLLHERGVPLAQYHLSTSPISACYGGRQSLAESPAINPR